MKATFLDEKGETRTMEMGCYGIGITRIVAAAIEQNHDVRGIAFPEPIAPFAVCIVPIGMRKNASVREAAERLETELSDAGVDVLLDDRDERPGVMFADMDLIGIPHRIVLSERGLAGGNVEYKGRRDEKAAEWPFAEVISRLRERVSAG
jgi:prolyl-tRNA synthetase